MKFNILCTGFFMVDVDVDVLEMATFGCKVVIYLNIVFSGHHVIDHIENLSDLPFWMFGRWPFGRIEELSFHSNYAFCERKDNNSRFQIE